MKHLIFVFLVGALFYTTICNAAQITTFTSDGSSTVDKPVIVVEGYDPFNNIEVNSYYDSNNDYVKGYNDYLPANFKNWLKSTGRDLIFITFNDTHKDLKLLAQEFRSALTTINNSKAGNHPNAIIGYSAGGLIARWALKEMENQNVDHETSAFITYDSPHRGATIPLSIIDGIDDISRKIPFGSVDSLDKISDSVNSFSAKQMLLGADHSGFLTELENFGYPNNLARFAVANGSDNGTYLNLPKNAEVYSYKAELLQISNEYQVLKQERHYSCSYPCDPSRNHDYDRAPGGYINSFEQYWENIEDADGNTHSALFDLDVYFKNQGYKNSSFVNILSALDIKNFDINAPLTTTMKNYGPFDDYATNSSNEAHNIIDGAIANGTTGKINQWLTTYHKIAATIPSRSHKKVSVHRMTGLDAEWIVGGQNSLSWDTVPGAIRYEVLLKNSSGYSKIYSTSSRFYMITVDNTTKVGVRACNQDQCGYPDFVNAVWKDSDHEMN